MSRFLREATFALVAVLALPVSAQSTPSVEGVWQGALTTPGGRLRLAFKVQRDMVTGKLSGTLDSIDQGARDIPLDTIELDDRSVRFELNRIRGRYDGELAASGNDIEGVWTQSGGSLPLDLRRDANVPVLRRPQEPSRPLPYKEEEMAYESQPGVRLAATLTLPEGNGPFPAVLLITGSGPQDRDEAVAGHRPFLVLADALTRRGIAVLRADDRGTARSTGTFATATVKDFAADALAGLRYLRGRADIRADAIGLAGHSEGGLVAPLVATTDAPEARALAFVVLLAAPGVPIEDILLEQSTLILRAQGAPTDLITANRSTQLRIFEILERESDATRAAAEMRTAMRDQLATVPESARAQAEAQVEQQLAMMTSEWMRDLVSYDPAETLRRVRAPVLALNGERDLQVSPKQNLPPIEAAIRAAAHPDSLVRELPGLNHLFQSATTGSPTEYSQIEETMSMDVTELVADWILARLK